MKLPTFFSDFPIAPFANHFTFQDHIYQTKVTEIDQQIQKRVVQYESQFEEKKTELLKEQAIEFEQKQKLYSAIGSVVGQALGLTAGLFLSLSLNVDSDSRPIYTYTCSFFSLCAGYQIGSQVGKSVAKIPPLNIRDWKRSFCVEEVSGLLKDWYEVISLIGALEERDKNHSDLPKLQQLDTSIRERIGQIRDIVKHLLAKNPDDLNPLDDIDLSFQHVEDGDSFIYPPIRMNSTGGVVSVPRSLLIKWKMSDYDLSIFKRIFLVMSISVLFEKCASLILLEPMMAAGGIAIVCTLLYLGRSEIEQMKEDFQRTSPVCKIVIIAYPILGISSPLFIVKNFIPSLTHTAIFNITCAAIAGFSRCVQRYKREIDAYFVQDIRFFRTTVVEKEGKQYELQARTRYLRLWGAENAQLEKRLLQLRQLLDGNASI